MHMLVKAKFDRAAYQREWRKRNPERVKEIIKRYRERHPEKVAEFARRASLKQRAKEIAEFGLPVRTYCPTCKSKLFSKDAPTCQWCRDLEAEEERATVPEVPCAFRILADELGDENAAVLVAAIEHGKNLYYCDWTPSNLRVTPPAPFAPADRYETEEPPNRVELPSKEEIAKATVSIEPPLSDGCRVAFKGCRPRKRPAPLFTNFAAIGDF